jgi:hypothetical protein
LILRRELPPSRASSFGLGLFVVAIFQWRVYGRQATIMDRQSTLAADQALISKQTQRAFVFLKEIAVSLNRTVGAVSAYGTEIPGAIQTWRVSPVWENSGDTPARRMLVNFNSQEFSGRMPDNFDFPDSDSPEPSLIGPRATVQGRGIVLAGDLISKIVNGSCKLYLWGWADYDDVFDGSPRRRTEFCFEVAVTGPQDGQVFLGFPLHRKYNGADDECLRRPAPYVPPI